MLEGQAASAETSFGAIEALSHLKRPEGGQWIVVRPDVEEQSLHERMLADLDRASGGRCLWRALDGAEILYTK